MIVKFAALCDYPDCGARSEEYRAWPSCRLCGGDFCPAHAAPGEEVEEEHDHFNGEYDEAVLTLSTLCLSCARGEWGQFHRSDL